LVPGTLEYAIHHVVEERLDLSIFDERYSNDETGRKAIAYQAPKTACHDCRLGSKFLRNPNTVSRQVHVFYGKRPGSLTDVR
jgi:hypothetical protein